MTSLLTDLAATPEGSRELSDRVLRLFGWDAAGGGWRRPEGGTMKWHAAPRPDPTRSVDDALALVPEGWRFNKLECAGDHGWRCQVWRTNPPAAEYCGYNDGMHPATPALALCIAILKAKEKDND